MTTQRQREIVIEIEKARTTRKRARTTLADCGGCGTTADFVELREAGGLFEVEPDVLFKFIRQNSCHYHESEVHTTYLCVPSLLEHMQKTNEIRRIGATGE